MTDLTAPLAGKTFSYVRNSKHFVEMLQGVRIQPEEVMVSFDVKSLFTNVPISEALEIMPEDYRMTQLWWTGRCCHRSVLSNSLNCAYVQPISPFVVVVTYNRKEQRWDPRSHQ